MLGLLRRVCMNTGKPFLEKELGEVLAIDIESADESTYFVRSLDVNLDVSLEAASVGKVMGFLSKRVRLFICIAG